MAFSGSGMLSQCAVVSVGSGTCTPSSTPSHRQRQRHATFQPDIRTVTVEGHDSSGQPTSLRLVVAQTVSAGGGSVDKQQVLIVEDEVLLHGILQEALEEAGFALTASATAGEAIAHLESEEA